MNIKWKGAWNKGEITIESDKVKELNDILTQLNKISEIKTTTTKLDTVETQSSGPDAMPEVNSKLGCAPAIRKILQSTWGKKVPRTMSKITEVLETNGLYFARGSISGTLTFMTKRNEIRRIKKDGMWAYIGK